MEKRALTPADSMLGETSVEMLDRFPQVFSYSSEIAKHQLGWRMAILPFRSVGAPGGYEIAFGMAEEISASIARFRSPRLMATATFWDGTGPADDVLGRCRMYELDYMMDGTINVTGTRVRINAVLLDVVLDFEVIWTGTFDGDLADLFTLQNEVAAEAVRQLDPDLYSRGPASQAPVRTQVARSPSSGADRDPGNLPLGSHPVHASARLVVAGHRARSRLCRGPCLARLLERYGRWSGLGARSRRT